MMAGTRSLLASLVATTRTSNGRKKFVVAAGSFVSFTSLSASAFLVESTAGRTSAQEVGWSQLLQSQLPDTLLSAAQPCNPSRTTRLSVQLFAKAQDEVEDIDTATAKKAQTKMQTGAAAFQTLQNRFRVGDSYVWLYHDVDGNPTSWEKYTITDIEENNDSDEMPQFVATIEMSTKFQNEDPYQTHHRIKANLMDHFLESSESHDDWRIGFEYYLSDKNSWKVFGEGVNVQAFEEKFDVFSMVATKSVGVVAKSKGTKGGAGESTEDPRDECLVPWTLTTTHCESSSETSAPNTRPALLSINNASGKRNQELLTQTRRHEYTEAWYGPSNHCTLSGIALYKEFPNSQHSFSLIEYTRKRGGSFVTNVIEVTV